MKKIICICLIALLISSAHSFPGKKKKNTKKPATAKGVAELDATTEISVSDASATAGDTADEGTASESASETTEADAASEPEKTQVGDILSGLNSKTYCIEGNSKLLRLN